MIKIVENFKRWVRRGYKPYTSDMNIRLAPIKKIYKIKCNTIPKEEVDAYMASVIEKIKNSPTFVDEKTNKYGLTYNTMSLTGSFWM